MTPAIHFKPLVFLFILCIILKCSLCRAYLVESIATNNSTVDRFLPLSENCNFMRVSYCLNLDEKTQALYVGKSKQDLESILTTQMDLHCRWHRRWRISSQ